MFYDSDDDLQINFIWDINSIYEDNENIMNNVINNENFINTEKGKEKGDIINNLENYLTDYHSNKINSFTYQKIDNPKNPENTNIKELVTSTKLEEKSNKIEDNTHKTFKILIGKKTQKSNNYKFSDDHFRKMCKQLIFDNLIIFINNLLKNIYKDGIGRGIFIKQLLPLGQEQTSCGKAKFNKQLLNKTLKEIFFEKISNKYTNFLKDHNKKIIIELLTDEKTGNCEYFRRLFNLKFLECLAHFNGSRYIEELEGMNTFAKIKDDLNEDQEFLDELEHYITNFEEIINSKKERTSKKINLAKQIKK